MIIVSLVDDESMHAYIGLARKRVQFRNPSSKWQHQPEKVNVGVNACD